VLAFGGNLETRASAQTSKFLIPKSSALPARDSYRVAQALRRSSVLSLGWGYFLAPLVSFLALQHYIKCQISLQPNKILRK
jgi:hypothetical protein